MSERATILAYATSIVLNRDLAEDIYQNVVVVVLRKRDEIDDSRDALRWILGVARVESLVAMRKRGAAPICLDAALIDQLDDNWTTHLEERRDSNASEALSHCLAKLTGRARQVLHLRYVDGHCGEPLAKELGVKINTAYVTLSRIHGQLRQCISAYRSRTHS